MKSDIHRRHCCVFRVVFVPKKANRAVWFWYDGSPLGPLKISLLTSLAFGLPFSTRVYVKSS